MSRALVGLLLVASPALAIDTVVSSKVQVYADSDATIVVSPHVNAAATIESSRTTLSGVYTEDVVSSASVDVRTTASPRIYDRRQEVDVGIGQEALGFTFGGAYVHARERDYLSNGGSLTVSRELFQKNTTVSLRGGFTSNVVGRADDPNFAAPMTDWSGDLAITQLFTATTLAQLNVTFARSDGMLASPYRRVSIWSGEGATPQFVLAEREPASRTRVAAAIGLKQYVLGFLALHADYRLYLDSWSLLSHTLDVRAVFDLGALSLRLRYRYYTQNGAFFYQARYAELRTYVSADREVSPFNSHLFGVKLEWSPRRTDFGAQFRFDVKVEGMYFSYANFPRLPTRWALITQAGVGVDF